MPKKLQTEVQFARLLGASPLQIELTLMTTETYVPKNTKKEHLIEFYKTLDDVKDDFFDVLITFEYDVTIVGCDNVVLEFINDLSDEIFSKKRQINSAVSIIPDVCNREKPFL